MTAWQPVRPEQGCAPGPQWESGALALLQALGRYGHSPVSSYSVQPHGAEESWAPVAVPPCLWHWLQERNLIRCLEVPVFGTRQLAVVHLTEVGRRYLRQRHLPHVPGEIEILCDRLGHSVKLHYGQALLFAHLARRLGYATGHGIPLPHRRAIADLRLVRGREVLYVSLESGLDRKGHPLDRWHVLAQAQAFLPLVAPDSARLDAAFGCARQQICQIRGVVLPDLEARLSRGARTLWCRRYNRFEQHGPEVCRPSRPAHLRAAAACQGLLRVTCRLRGKPESR